MSQLEDALVYWATHPIEAVKDLFDVTPENYQGDILTALFDKEGGSRVAAKSAHGVGKTTVLSWATWLFEVTRPHARMVATAPTQSQLKDTLWPEIAKWHYRMPEDLKNMFEVSETHLRHKLFPKTWFGVARTSNKPENLQGFHQDHILVLVDEASGVPGPVLEVIEGILTNADEEGQEALLVMTGNPTQTSGEFYNAFNKNKVLYKRFTISGDFEKPKDRNGGQIYLSRRVSARYRDTMARKYGTSSPVYDVRVRGVFPEAADDVVIPFAWADRAQYIELPYFDHIADTIRLVMDVARFGGDETVLGIFRGRHCLDIKAWPKTSTTQCVDILTEHFKQSKVLVSQIIIDEPGIGGGVVDFARRAGLPVTPYNGGASLKVASEGDIGDPEEDVRMFANRRSRDWWNVRRAMEHSTTKIPVDETTVNQLASVKFQYNSREKIQVETKADMRERLGDDASPDRADVIVMGLAPYYSLIDAIPMDILVPGSVMYGEDRPAALQAEEFDYHG